MSIVDEYVLQHSIQYELMFIETICINNVFIYDDFHEEEVEINCMKRIV